MVFLVGLIYLSGPLPNHPFLYAFVLHPTQDEGFSFFSGMLRLQHLLCCALRTF